MDNNNWRPIQGSEPAIDTVDWRTQLQPDSRQRIVNKIMDTLKKHLPFSGQDGLHELKKIAERFEEKIYTAATSQSDYLRKISLKMLTMETKSQNTIPNAMPNNPVGTSNRPPDQGSLGMQSQQMHNPAQSLGMTLPPNQPQNRQQMMPQNIQNPAGVQTTSSISSQLPPSSNLTQTSIPNVGQNMQNTNLQGVPASSQGSVGNPMGQSVGNMYAQRQMQGRQPVVNQQQQQQQQPQNSQQFLYQQQLQQQLLKPKFNQGNMPQSILQPHMPQQQQQQQQQQQNILQPNQLQPSQQSVLQTSSAMQPPLMQSSPLMNQQSSVQQPTKPMLQQHPQSVLRQQQQQQQSQQASVSHPQQQLMSQQPNSTNMQQTHLIGQQNNVGDMQQQQQRLLGQQNNLPNLQQQQQQLLAQQNNLSNLHQQQLGPQSNVNGLPQQQQQMLVGNQTANSNMQPNQHSVHMLQQSKGPLQQQSQQAASNLLQNQSQQTQPQSQQQQMMSQIPSQPTQMQQQLGMQQQPNVLQREMPQRLQGSGQTSGSLLQTQNVMDQQKQMYQAQRVPETSSTSMDSTAQTGHANGGDWQEEVYQKICKMKELYFPELSDMYQKITTKLQQHDSLPQPPKSEQFDKLKLFKSMLERAMTFLQVSKANILPGFKEKLVHYEKQIINFINTSKPRKPVSQMPQGQLQPSHMQQAQLQSSQMNQVQSHENQMNSQMQPMNAQGSVGTMQPNNMANLQQNSMSSLSGVTAPQQNMMNSLQPNSTMDSVQGNSLNSLQQVSAGNMQQNNPVSTPVSQQANVNAMPSQNGMNSLQPNINTLQSNSGMLQHPHIKQEQQMLQSQQFKQLQRQQLLQKQQLLQQHQHHQQQQQQQQQPQQQQQQQQQLQQQAKQQLPTQLPAHQNQMQQLHQMNDVNDVKMRPGMGMKPGVLQQHLPAGQRNVYPINQPMKSNSSFSISSSQLLQASSPQLLQHSSPQVDQQSLLPSIPKTGTPLQSASSPFVVPSPSTPLAPSPMPGDSEKPVPGASSLSNAGNVGGQQQNVVVTPAQSLAIGTPGISASPLLAEFSGPDGTHGNALAAVPGKSSEQPIDRLIKAVKSMSSKALSASVSDIGSVVSMIDRIAGSAPGNGSRAAVGEDLVAMTKCRFQVRNFITHDGTNGTRKMKRYTSAMPLNVVSSANSVNDSFKQLNGSETSELESTATSGFKRPRLQANHALLEEIREINQRLIDTVVDISDEDVDPIGAAIAVDGGEGTIVKCSFSAVALSPNLKSQYASARMSPIQPLRLLVPTNYPSCSPILLDKLPVEISKEYEDLSVKAKSRFSISLRSLSQPMSLEAIAKTWDVCARAVISELAQQSGGGSFSSKYGTWESCLSTA